MTEFEKHFARGKRFKQLCAKLRNGSGTVDDWREAWDLAQAEEAEEDYLGRPGVDLVGLIPDWNPRPIVDPIEHMAAVSEWCP